MATFLGLDVGDRWVGTAIADSEVRIALPHLTFGRAKGAAEAGLLALIAERKIKTVVAGLPLDEDGRPTAQSEKIERFCRRIARRADVEIHFVDEHLTSFESEQQLEEAARSLRSAKRRGITDAVAASKILQAFLDDRSAALPGR